MAHHRPPPAQRISPPEGHLHPRPLHRGALVSLTDVRCRAPAGHGREEQSLAASLVFVRSGVFVRHVRGRAVTGDPGHVLFFNGAESYRVSHPTSAGDDCTSATFPAAALRDALAPWDPAAEADAPSFPITHAPLAPRLVLECHLLRAGARAGTASALELEERALALLEGVVAGAFRAHGVHARARRALTARARCELAERVKLVIARDPAAPCSLADIAREVAASPFHLARAFRDETGVPVHQYQLRVRLALALERLAEGAPSLSALALDLGFSSHAHLSTLARRAFGAPPAALRRALTPARARELRKKLKV
ncbi:MAG TPA: AraC family transcriptional regulator [Gemmatimonadaceae bacterium]